MKIINYLYRLELVIFLLISTQCLDGQIYHVDINSSGGDGSLENPWDNIQDAMDFAVPGSTVLIHGGVYNESLYVNVSGEDGMYITFKNFDNEEVIVDGTGRTSYALIEIYNVHHVILEGITIRNHEQLDAVGILIEEDCDHITINNCTIYNINFSSDVNAQITSNTNAQPIAIYGTSSSHIMTNINIINNEVYNCRIGYSEGLVINGNVDGFVVKGNIIHDLTNIGIDIIGHEGTCNDPNLDQARNGLISENNTYNCLSPYATSAGIYVDGGRDLIIERNRVYNNQWGIEVGCENVGKTASDIIIRNNFIYGNQTSGLAIGGYDYPNGSGKVTRVKVVNNTLYDNDQEDDFSGEIFLSYNEDLLMQNNNIHGGSPHGYLLSSEDLSPSLNVNLDYNNWYSKAGEGKEEFYYNGIDYQGYQSFLSESNTGAIGISIESEFVDGSLGDLHLDANSQLIDAGHSVNDIGLYDIDGDMRVFNGSVDIGADEYNGTVGILTNKQKEIIIYPTIAQSKIYSNEIIGNYSISNYYGQVIKMGEANREIDISLLNEGIHYLHANNGFIKFFVSKW